MDCDIVDLLAPGSEREGLNIGEDDDHFWGDIFERNALEAVDFDCPQHGGSLQKIEQIRGSGSVYCPRP